MVRKAVRMARPSPSGATIELVDAYRCLAEYRWTAWPPGHDRTTTRALNASGLGELVRVHRSLDATAYCPRALYDDIPTHSSRNDVRFLISVAAAVNLRGETL